MKIKQNLPAIFSTGYLFFSMVSIAHAQQLSVKPPSQLTTSNITINSLLAFVINAFFAVGVIAALIYLLWGGFNWVVSGGDKDKIAAARARMIAAIVGLVAIVLSYFILNFALQLLGMCGINNLQIPTLTQPSASASGCAGGNPPLSG